MTTPTAHTELLLNLHKALDSDAFKNMKYMVKAGEFGGFQPGELEMIITPRDMLEKLEQKGIIRVGDYRKLKELMEKIDRRVLIDTIEVTEKELHKQGLIPKKLQPSGDNITYTTNIHGVTNSPITVGTSTGNTTNYGESATATAGATAAAAKTEEASRTGPGYKTPDNIEVLGTKHIARISKDIGKWKLLAAELEFKEADIERFAADAPLDQVEQTRKMLSEWVSKNAERDDSVDVLISALRNSDRNDVVKKHFPPTS